MRDNFSIVNESGELLPRLPLARIKNDILGKKYCLSLAFVDKKKSREINKRYRKKDKPTNILSFSFSKTEGEILMCPNIVRQEVKNKAESSNRTFRGYMGFLVIHGMLHLEGMKHSSKMDRAEEKYDKKYFYRNRRGVGNYPSRGGRVFKGRKKS